MAAAGGGGGVVVVLPPLTDLHQVFNPGVAPPLAMNNSVATTTAKAQSDSGAGAANVLSKLKLALGVRGADARAPVISGPVNFRHVVHVSGTTIEMYGADEKTQNKDDDLEMLELSKVNNSFGMHLKTHDNGKTVITLLPEGGAATMTGRLDIGDEIVMIDGEKIRGMKHEDVIARLRNKTRVQLHIAKHKETEASKSQQQGAKQPVPNTCRVCGNTASFNCSACGVDVMYCSSACQKSDWPKHKLECLVMKKDIDKPGPSAPAKPSPASAAVPLTGACRVCRDKNARYRCSCAGAMYCSQKCQASDWGAHKFHCNSHYGMMGRTATGAAAATGGAAAAAAAVPADFSFYVTLDRHVLKMAFSNGVFEYLWTTELSKTELSAVASYPTLHIRGKSVFVSAMSFLYRLDAETGRLVWSYNLGYPFNGDPFVLELVGDSLLIAAAAGQLVAVNQSDGSELSRKLLSRTFEPVTLLRTNRLLVAVAGGDVFGIQVSKTSRDPFTLAWRTPLEIHTHGTICAALAQLGADDEDADAKLVVCTDRVNVLRMADGTLLAMSTKLLGPPPNVIANVHVLSVLPASSMLLCWRVTTGTLLLVDPGTWSESWAQTLDECRGREATLLRNSIVYEGSDAPRGVVYVGVFLRIAAVDLATGEVLWIAKLSNVKDTDLTAGIVSIMRIQDTLIAAAAGKVYALSANNGNPLRKAQLPQNADPSRFISVSTSADPSQNSSVLPGQVVLFRRE